MIERPSLRSGNAFCAVKRTPSRQLATTAATITTIRRSEGRHGLRVRFGPDTGKGHQPFHDRLGGKGQVERQEGAAIRRHARRAVQRGLTGDDQLLEGGHLEGEVVHAHLRVPLHDEPERHAVHDAFVAVLTFAAAVEQQARQRRQAVALRARPSFDQASQPLTSIDVHGVGL